VEICPPEDPPSGSELKNGCGGVGLPVRWLYSNCGGGRERLPAYLLIYQSLTGRHSSQKRIYFHLKAALCWRQLHLAGWMFWDTLLCGNDWARMGVYWYLTCSTDDISTIPQLCIGCSEERSLAQNTSKKQSPGRFQQPQIRAFTANATADVPPHHLLLLLLGLATRSPLEKVSGREYDLAVRPQSQCSAIPMLTSDANLLFAFRPALALVSSSAAPGAPHSRASFPFAC
jgi:hypothetical protein